MNVSQKIALCGGVVVAALVAGSSAQTTSMPSVDLSLGPLVLTSQAVNVALALSVEFPTAGAAYRQGSYDHNQEYLGYWDPKGCYQYFDIADTSTLAGNYFRRTGTVDSDRYCDGTSYSGNVLNYAATSSIDLLRYALTGGNRVLDATDKTVLGRAFLPSDFGGIRNGTYFPQKQVAGTLVGRVTPQFITPGGTTRFTDTVFFNSCDDLLYVGNASSGGSCTDPGNTNVFGPSVPNTAGGFTEQSFASPPADTSTNTYVLDPAGKKEWKRSQPEATTTVMPSGSDPAAGTLVPEPVSPTPRNNIVVSTGSTPQRPGDPQVGTTYTATGNLVTTIPPTGAPDRTQQGTRWVPNVTNADTNPTLAHGVAYGEGLLSELAPGSPQTLVHTSSHSVCRSSGGVNIRLRINSSGNTCTGSGGSSSNRSVSTYVMYTSVPVYKEYTATPVYNYYQEIPTWYQMSLYTVYRVYGNTQARMKAYVQVCDATEAPTRADSDGVRLCKRYPDDAASTGVYKPVGELQKKAESVRVSAFGYAMENSNSRYGGVMRAPMKFLGAQYRDTNGILQSNSQAEWDANTGIFTVNPLNDTTYSSSGVVNYLNKFGSTGRYKGLDPVGELYYETLRYYQGLGPTAAATNNLTSTMYDNFPIYTSWTDPIQNSCQRRNFILAIGDVNTHNDKQLPGHRSSEGVNETTNDPARAAVAIPGSTTATFNAVDWTKIIAGFETGTNIAYTDALGRSQNTLGNPNTVSTNSGLGTKATGSGSSSAYYWAGAAYWANTQSIRLDSKTVDGRTESLKDIRVKTFTIDVDEGGNGSIDANTRSIAPRNSSFFLAGKYGWFNDANEDGNPFKSSGGTISNKEWEDLSQPTVPDGYVLASQARRMIAGIRKFFEAVNTQTGTVSASAVSTQRFTARSPNGDFYAPNFNAGDWSGTVIKTGLQLNTETQSIDALSDVVWDSGKILTQGSLLNDSTASADPYVKPAERKIFTYRRDAGNNVSIAFTAANLSSLDAAMRTNLNTNPATGTTDNLGAERVNYLRGVRSQESPGPNRFRVRNSIMGDIINSGPVYKQGADKNIAGDSTYPTFVSAVADRTATLYVGANDGMLHALRASDGKELFAYVPLAVASNLNKLTNPSYRHTPYVDAVPQVGEVKIGTAWRTVLVSGMGGGAQGVFALDVTDPTRFEDGSDNASKVLFEFTDQDDALMGNVVGQPQLMKIKIPPTTTGGSATYKWFVVVGSGYNNYVADGSGRYGSGSQALFFLSLDKPRGTAWTEGTNYFKVVVPNSDSSLANGLANPGRALGSQGEASTLYAGDLQGNLWKFDLSNGLSSQNITNKIILNDGSRPLFTARTAGTTAQPGGTRQPITVAPQVVATGRGGYMVVFGTGKFIEQTDASSTGSQSIYSVWDNNGEATTDFNLTRSNLATNTLTEGTTVTITPTSYTLGTLTGNKRGWVLDLANLRERVAVEGAQGFSSITFNSTIPTGNCSGDGDGRSYTLNPLTGAAVTTIALGTDGGMLGVPIYLDIELATGNYSVRDTSGSRSFTSAERVISPTTKLTGNNSVPKVVSSQLIQDTVRAGRVSWREVRNFKD